MGRKSKYTIEEKVDAVQEYQTGKRRPTQICNDLKIGKRTLYKWTFIYEKYGERRN